MFTPGLALIANSGLFFGGSPSLSNHIQLHWSDVSPAHVQNVPVRNELQGQQLWCETSLPSFSHLVNAFLCQRNTCTTATLTPSIQKNKMNNIQGINVKPTSVRLAAAHLSAVSDVKVINAQRGAQETNVDIDVMVMNVSVGKALSLCD